MAVFIWKHRSSPEDVRHRIQHRLQAADINDKVVWKGNRFTASVGWGVILNLVGEIKEK